MNESAGEQNLTGRIGQERHSTFRSIFFSTGCSVPVRVPDYQRAYSWEQKQIELFIGDLVKYQGGDKGYYFGHFIAEEAGENWEIVDGQQRITTFVLFLMVCRVLSSSDTHKSACSMIKQFSTVSYDLDALGRIGVNLGEFLNAYGAFDERKPPSDEQIIHGLKLSGTFTRSQRRLVLALLRIHQAFVNGKLKKERIGDYIAAVMSAHCSHHLTQVKSVAVNIFEMNNTRGVPLTTLEIVKALLMKFVYDNGGTDRETKVSLIQMEFGEIYGMEERLAVRSFRGEMTMEQLFRLHLRIVDDGAKRAATDFHSPASNANAEALIEYVDARLRFIGGDKTQPEKPKEDGVEYALNLAKEFKKSVRIVSEALPAWDEKDALVGDVLILDRDLSCQFFLHICRRLESEHDKGDGRIGKETLGLWEKLLFTRDFHDGYYNLKGGRDDFPALYAECGPDEESVSAAIRRYLEDGFRPFDRTKGLQSIVAKYLNENREQILNNAFYWGKHKLIYAIYKYEISKGADVRAVMKDTVSVEHILPQEWQWEWISGVKGSHEALSAEQKEEWLKHVGSYINGIGNLLLITPSGNTTLGNKHPAEKEYKNFCEGGSYTEHQDNRESWRDSNKWQGLIQDRGGKIFKFMLATLVDVSESV